MNLHQVRVRCIIAAGKRSLHSHSFETQQKETISMKRMGRLLMASGAAGLILSAFVAASSTAAMAQDDGSWNLSPSTGEAATQPDSKKPPLDLNGCWCGTIDETKNGEGTGV